MANVIAGVPLIQLHADFETALDRQEELGVLMAAYTAEVDAREKEWLREYNSRMKIIRGVSQQAPSLVLPK
jgi:hypothetical protein